MNYKIRFDQLCETRPILRAAFEYASYEHRAVGQKRKHSDEEYEVHPMQVAVYMADTIHGTEMAMATGVLHDVLEDTLRAGETVDQAAHRMFIYFQARFGDEVADELVRRTLQVTDVSKKEDGVRAIRKQMDCDHAAKADAEQQTLKCADFKSNMPSMVKNDYGFVRKRWLPEKEAMLARMTAADPVLRAECLAMAKAFHDKTFNPDAYEIV